MPRIVRLEFNRRPSALRYMANALYPSPGIPSDGTFPDIAGRWANYRPTRKDREDFIRLSGNQAASGDHLPLLYLHTISFRLQMALMTHPVFPVPMWNVLQIRNHVLQHRPVGLDETLDFETRIATHRALEKGLEVDLHTTVRSGGTIAWESLNTVYIRGRFRNPTAPSPLADAPRVSDGIVTQWRMPGGDNWRFGKLTGDYNGIHFFDPYARRFGFKAAFFHPQRVIGHCLAHLPKIGETRIRLDTWLKGPVFYGSNVRMHAMQTANGYAFALYCDDEQRPSILGRVSHALNSAGLGAANIAAAGATA